MLKSFQRLGFLAFLLLLAQAQAVELRFLHLLREKVPEREFYLGDPDRKTHEPLSFHPGSRAIPVNPVKGRILLQALNRSEPAAKPVEFSVALDPAIKRGLVVLLPDPQAPAGVRGEAFEYDPASFAKGSFRFLNASRREWTVYLGGQRALLAKSRKPMDILPAAGGERFATVEIATLKEPLKPRLRSLWKLDANLCQLVLLQSDDAENAVPQIVILELPPP